MSRVEEKVFESKLEALRYNREHGVQFFSANIPGNEERGPKKVYVVAVSLHRAQIALVDYLMDLTKWPKRLQDDSYIEELELASQEEKGQEST